METRFKFDGEVGQVFSGSATFTAPQTFHQVNNVTLNTQVAEQQLSMRERACFARRVEDVAAAEGIKPDAVYRILLEDYGGATPGIKRWLTRTGRWALLVSVAVAAVVVMMATGAPSHAPALHCRWEGKDFSVGAVSNMGTRDVYECVYDLSAHAYPYWAPARNLDDQVSSQQG
ncbi:hypothetical protein SAMN04488595_109191 [Ralstonia sp. 25mfcol4.1]|uniref:hypothetical protein n=1 Tax=Ralstonia sp. 25mfcol4.1 TaxID=1761899 RepID=UPI0008827716|nr:hypothetical protein [Ralstonia sp. 25mfcol4.1]SDP45909.1 hypothetical protein SAMN04488595_109191 [Ralstonia sp. 25mfcol4.1]